MECMECMEWEHINNKTPERGDNVFVSDGKKVDVDIFDGEEFVHFDNKVTHWMPFPYPPE